MRKLKRRAPQRMNRATIEKHARARKLERAQVRLVKQQVIDFVVHLDEDELRELVISVLCGQARLNIARTRRAYTRVLL